MRSIKWIPLETWLSWDDAQRANFTADCETRGVRWALDLNAKTEAQIIAEDQKDFDEEESGENR